MQQDLESSDDGAVNPIIRQIPVIKFPVEPISYNNYDFGQSPVFSDSPSIYESPSLHDASPFIPEFASYPRTVFRSSLYSYDDMGLYGRDSSLIRDPPQLYKD
ncbi:hypothetical protein AVEN_261102-1 [Araneus ventricosus]|uniref:Uncharacterized protein n=1 Tax=Araneus ventricosus TaxID=182803 RepID=A0A4Y2CT34_ARAVE|nr:hypothetical protein AVEN_261102-1 [Araneus ventricosus]